MRTQFPLKLSRSPLVYVVMQVRIAAVMAMESYIPGIQDSLRRSGYPKFARSRIREIRFEVGEDPKQSTADRFEFQRRDGRTGLVLTGSTVAFHTNNYGGFEDFLGEFGRVVGVIHPILGIEFAERLGLRYVDVVRPSKGERFEQYIVPGILGPEAARLGMERSFSRFDMVGKTKAGILALRHWQMSNGNFLPPDLLPSTLSPAMALGAEEEVGVLDFDHFTEKQFDFEVGEIEKIAWQLHGDLDKAFRAVTTEFALEQWGNLEEEGGTK